MIPCDLMIRSRWCLPIAPDPKPIERGALAIEGGRILAIGPAAELDARYQPKAAIDLSNHALLPGLVNAHCHAAMSLLRGAAEDLALEAWLNDAIWPLEGRVVSPEFVRTGTDLAIAEMLARGITCFADMYFFPEEAAQRVSVAGLRAQVAFPIIDFPNPWSSGSAEGFHKGLELHDAYRDDPRIGIAFGPHAAYSVERANLEKTLMYSEEVGRPIQIHLHESAEEVAAAVARNGHSWVAELAEIGLLNPSLQAVHMTELSDADIELVAEHGVQVVNCPTSNLKLANGICPVPRLAAAGVNVALGTDGAASNNALDLFAEARLAALLAKHLGGAAAGKVDDALRMATLNGAAALGLADEIGSIEPGKQADLIAVDLSGPSLSPVRDPAAALVHGPAGEAVSHVWVAGRCLYADGDYQTFDIASLKREVELAAEGLG